MQRVAGAPGELAIDREQVRDPADLGRDHDPVGGKADRLGPPGARQRRDHQRLAQHVLGRLGLGQTRVVVHHPGRQILVQAAPVDPDPDRLVVPECHLDHHLELAVALGAEADVAGVDAELGERRRAVRMAGQEQVAVVVEVADQGHVVAAQPEPLADPRHRERGLVGVDRDAHDLGAGVGELDDLLGGGGDVGGVGVGHRLDDDRRAAADHDLADPDGMGPLPLDPAQCDHIRSIFARAGPELRPSGARPAGSRPSVARIIRSFVSDARSRGQRASGRPKCSRRLDGSSGT